MKPWQMQTRRSSLIQKTPVRLKFADMVLGSKGDYENAFMAYNKAIEMDPKNSRAFDARSNILLRKGEYDRAIADATKAIEIDPKNSSAFENRGYALLRKGEHDRAIADTTMAIEIDPTNVSAVGVRGNAYEAKGDYDAAVADYSKLATLDPKNVRYARSLGFARFYQGNFNGASLSLLRAAELRSDPYVVVLLYLARKRAGEPGEAELEENIKRLPSKTWPYAFAELYLGRRSQDALLESATTATFRCQAYFFIGEWKLSNNDVAEGVKLLTNATEICSKDYPEFRAATAELKRLKP